MADYKDIITGTISNIMGKVKEVAENPNVKEAVDKVKAAAEDTVGKVKEAAEGSTVKEVYEQGASRVKSYGRIAKLSLEMNGDYEELKRVYTEIGKLCYDQFKDAPEGFFAPLFAQVEEISARIERSEAEIEAMKAEVGCQEEPDISVEIVADSVEDAAEEFKAAAEEFQNVVDATETEGSATEE
ncbi:MAG: hypothetical protein J6J19_08095 [Oscillospiraceae bacterium]|nr:hypothetical protein [Oscillospiraceae bacterium]